jgi:hypothetical protein
MRFTLGVFPGLRSFSKCLRESGLLDADFLGAAFFALPDRWADFFFAMYASFSSEDSTSVSSRVYGKTSRADALVFRLGNFFTRHPVPGMQTTEGIVRAPSIPPRANFR